MSMPSGWYPSPSNSGEEIRWDGEKWTGETRPVTSSGEAPADNVAAPGDGEDAPAVPRLRFPVWAMIVIPVAVVLVVVVALVAFLVVIPASNEAANQAAAVAACKQLTLDQLKAPASAKFGPMKPQDLIAALNAEAKSNGGPTTTPKPSKDGSKSYIFSSYVDAQNGFGALIRNSVSCVVVVKDGKASSKDSVAIVTSNDQ